MEIFRDEVYDLQDEQSVPVNEENWRGYKICIEVRDQEAITVTEIKTNGNEK